jgi:hypothetical protein
MRRCDLWKDLRKAVAIFTGRHATDHLAVGAVGGADRIGSNDTICVSCTVKNEVMFCGFNVHLSALDVTCGPCRDPDGVTEASEMEEVRAWR